MIVLVPLSPIKSVVQIKVNAVIDFIGTDVNVWRQMVRFHF